MARVVYGVAGEGSGHSTRARVVAQHLLQQGHEVRLASYDRGYRNLSSQFDVLQIAGLTIGSQNNRVSVRKTIRDNWARLPAAKQSLDTLRELFKGWQPHAVITDFEPMTAYLAHHYGIPLISLDNQQRMRYVRAPIPPGLENEARWTRAVIRGVVPKPDACLITTFVVGEPRHERVFQFPPIVDPQVVVRRDSVTQAHDAPILVYVTSGFDSLLDQLREVTHERFCIYGAPSPAEPRPHMSYQAACRDGFLDDLCRCKAVIATAGFTLISEALYLRKPYLAYPMQGQYEQQLNAYQLQTAGLGCMGRSVERKEIEAFLQRLPDYSDALANHPRSDNTDLLTKMDELLVGEAALATSYRQQRKGQVHL